MPISRLFSGLALCMCAALAFAQADEPPADLEQQDATYLSVEEKAKLRNILAEQAPASAPPKELLAFYVKQRHAAERLGDYQAQIQLARNWLASDLPPKLKIGARFLLWFALVDAGNRVEAMAVAQALLPDVTYLPDQIMARTILSKHYLNEFKTKEARELQNEAFDLLKKESERQVKRNAGYLFDLKKAEAHLFQTQARLLLDQGKYTEAVAAARSSVETGATLSDMSGTLTERQQFLAKNTYLNGLKTQLFALSQASRLYEAEGVAYQVLQKSHEYRSPPNHLVAAHNFIADLRLAQGRFTAALQNADKAIALAKEAGGHDGSSSVLYATQRKIFALVGMERWQEAKQVLDASNTMVDDAVNAKINDGFRVPRALILLFNNDADRAAVLLQGVYKNNLRKFGQRHFFTAQAAGLYAMVLYRQGKPDAARPLFAQAMANLRSPEGAGEGYEETGLRKLYRRLMLQAYIELLTAPGQTAGIDNAYAVADYLRGSVVQQSVVDSAIRSTASVAGLGELVRREQDSKNEIAALYAFLTRQLAEPAARQLPKVIEEMRHRIEMLEAERDGLHRQIAQQFPEYDRLVHPQPPTATETAQQLGNGEVLVSILPDAARTYVWAVRSDGKTAFHAANQNAAQIDALVKRLRATLDIGELPQSAVPSFDADAAYQLYRQLLQPLEADLRDARHLIVSAAGSLGQIPFAVLLTEPAAGSGNHAWLIRQMAISHVPSVSAWVALKRSAQAALPQRQPFIGFGDPVFSAGAAQAGAAQATRKLTLTRAIGSDPDQAPVPALLYAKLPALPETRDEITAIARALHANPAKDAFFGRAASRSKVLSTPLHDRQIVAFATHGLVPGDLPGLTQPALALAAGEDSNPLLTLEDVLNLKLNADWVVLSACNTAAADGQASEAISGLGRGFFYAGAKALLVTHWAVESQSAKDLTTATFKRFGASRTIARAEALRQAQLEVMKKPGYAHPFFWAPYALIGEGGR